jgi:hypothetical protein
MDFQMDTFAVRFCLIGAWWLTGQLTLARAYHAAEPGIIPGQAEMAC